MSSGDELLEAVYVRFHELFRRLDVDAACNRLHGRCKNEAQRSSVEELHGKLLARLALVVLVERGSGAPPIESVSKILARLKKPHFDAWVFATTLGDLTDMLISLQYGVPSKKLDSNISELRDLIVLLELCRSLAEAIDNEYAPSESIYWALEIGKRLPIFSMALGLEIGDSQLALISSHENIAETLHRKRSGTGGQQKAARQRKDKLTLLAPLLEELKLLRFSGGQKSCQGTVNALLSDARFEAINEAVYGQEISYEKFLMPEAKKIWNECVKSQPPKDNV